MSNFDAQQHKHGDYIEGCNAAIAVNPLSVPRPGARIRTKRDAEQEMLAGAPGDSIGPVSGDSPSAGALAGIGGTQPLSVTQDNFSADFFWLGLAHPAERLAMLWELAFEMALPEKFSRWGEANPAIAKRFTDAKVSTAVLDGVSAYLLVGTGGTQYVRRYHDAASLEDAIVGLLGDVSRGAVMGDWLDEQEFYEVCQRYRLASPADPQETVDAFEALKAFIREREQAAVTRKNPQ